MPRGCRKPVHFNPRSPHGERQELPALRDAIWHFNPRSPHGERRPLLWLTQAILTHFNPRSPHGERLDAIPGSAKGGNFNPRSPHGERRCAISFAKNLEKISIHAPRTGSDNLPHVGKNTVGEFQSTLPARGATRYPSFIWLVHQFQSTLPARGATRYNFADFGKRRISIHAPRTGSDAPTSVISGEHRNFNPRSPHGERRIVFRALCP